MSERGVPSMRPRRPAPLRAPLRALRRAVMLAAVAWPAIAQDAPATRPGRATAAEIAALADSVEAMRARATEARRQFDLAQARATEVPDDSLSLSGATVLIRSLDVPPRERARLATAFARVEAQLQRQFGDDGPSLLAATRWRIQVYRRQGVLTSHTVVFAPEPRNSQTGAPVLRIPIDVDYAAELVRRGVGEQLLRRHPVLERWLGGSFWLNEAATTYYFAARDLALHGNERSRSCARGSLEDCGRILDPARYGTWRTPGESTQRGPTSNTVRSSVLQYAIQRGGSGLIAALAAAPDSVTPIALLADAVGESPDAFLAGWQETVTEGGRVRSRVAPRLLLTSAAWIALFGFVATRRRPR